MRSPFLIKFRTEDQTFDLFSYSSRQQWIGVFNVYQRQKSQQIKINDLSRECGGVDSVTNSGEINVVQYMVVSQ